MSESSCPQLEALILAGGRGTRLRPAVADRPKVLATVAGRPFLAYLLTQLDRAGVRRAGLCTGYRAEEVRRTFGSAFGGMELFYSREPVPLGTGGALRLAAGRIRTAAVLAMNGDSYCDLDLGSLVRFHREHGAPATVALTEVPDVSRYGCVDLGADNRIRGFAEKGGRTGPGWINAGVYVLEKRFLETMLPADSRISLERDVFPRCIDDGLYGMCTSGGFIDIGTPVSYQRAQRFFGGSQ